MYNLHAVANRLHGRITVFVGGELANTCHSAEIIDWYPGGDRIYVVDPGAAQVFISEKTHPGPCLEVLVPWQRTVDIFDEAHSKVEIFVNEQKVLTVAIHDSKPEYDVYRLLVMPENTYLIIPDGQIVPMIYQKVFGPASYEACANYVKEHRKGAA